MTREAMHWTDGFIAVDWGTTNRRAYRIDGNGRLADELEDECGILSVAPEAFGGAVEQIRARLGALPMLLGGMVGSNRGWREAPYVRCPADLSGLAAKLLWVEPGRVAIVPGVALDEGEAADVMRGEEMQMVGAVASGLMPADALVCHPGTHNKWVRVESGAITHFRTVMTGELFNLLKGHSILADFMRGEVEPNAAFTSGVAHGLAHDDVTAELFSIRARVLLGKALAENAASYASGLLIGTDLRIGLRMADDEAEIIVMGRPELTSLYAAALECAGRKAREVDGERAFIAGAIAIARELS